MGRSASKENLAKKHYRQNFHPQRALSKINKATYEHIESLEIGSLFEFGCGVGRHLERLKPNGIKCVGIDVNKKAVNEAARKGLAVIWGDESKLKDIPSNSFDVVLTNSVLCHIPEIDGIVSELKRIAKKHVIMVERQEDAEGFWYVHEYEGEKVFTMTTETTGYDYTLFDLCVES